MRRLVPCFFVALAGGACGLNVVGAIESAPSNADAGLDARAADGARDLRGDGDAANVDAAGDAAPTLCSAGQVHCGATCVDADDCAACGAATILCKLTRACVTSCDSCLGTEGAANPILCVACDPEQDNPVATCEANAPATFCLSGDYSQAYRNGPGRECDCDDTEVDNCPAENQVCVPSKGTDDCKTCGAPATSGGECKGGRTCNTSVSPARCQ